MAPIADQSHDPRRVVGLGGFEPPTSPLSGVRSNQLSYRPESGSAEPAKALLFSLKNQATYVDALADVSAYR